MICCACFSTIEQFYLHSKLGLLKNPILANYETYLIKHLLRNKCRFEHANFPLKVCKLGWNWETGNLPSSPFHFYNCVDRKSKARKAKNLDLRFSFKNQTRSKNKMNGLKPNMLFFSELTEKYYWFKINTFLRTLESGHSEFY